jgi:hypothetical protein
MDLSSRNDGNAPQATLARVDARVEDIRAHQEIELLRARLAAQGLSRP